MNSKKFWAAMGKALAAVTVTLIAVLLVAPGAVAASKFKTLHRFKGKDGRQLEAGVILDAAGNLYGTTYGGGPAYGVVFKLTPKPDGSWRESVLYNFQWGFDGSLPAASLVFDAAGNLYGTTSAGGGACYCGTVFKLTPNQDGSWTESVLYSFMGGSDGGGPVASLIFDSAGSLYGTTAGGGSFGNGTVFKLTPNRDGSWTESVLYSFMGGSDGGGPVASLIFDSAGSLYGTTAGGGSFGNGTVFKLTPNRDGSWTDSVLYSFMGGSDGGDPVASLIFDSTGSLYGTTAGGGSLGNGTVFKLTPNRDGSWTEQVLHGFSYKDGEYPSAGLILDAAGNLYGTTAMGGAYGVGVAFEMRLKPSGKWGYRVLHSFADRPGALVLAGLTIDAAGNLYGTTCGDGTRTHGSVFEITP